MRIIIVWGKEEKLLNKLLPKGWNKLRGEGK